MEENQQKTCEQCGKQKPFTEFYKRLSTFMNRTDGWRSECIACFKINTPEKKCDTCHKVKSIDDFPVHSSSFDSHRNTCASCLDIHKVQEKQRRAQHKIDENKRKEAERVQREKENALLKAYGYKWKKEHVVVEVWEGEWEEREQFILYTPGGSKITIQDAIAKITNLQTPKYGHPSTIWAQNMLSLPNLVILDTETTGLTGNDEIIEMAIIDTLERERMNMLLQCEMAKIPIEASKIHRITKLHLQNARTFPQIWETLMKFLASRVILIYNAEYDMRMLEQTAKRYNLPMPHLQVHCLMKQVSPYIGGEKKYYSLETACYHFGIEQPSAHRALVDTQMSLKVLQEMAKFASEQQ